MAFLFLFSAKTFASGFGGIELGYGNSTPKMLLGKSKDSLVLGGTAGAVFGAFSLELAFNRYINGRSDFVFREQNAEYNLSLSLTQLLFVVTYSRIRLGAGPVYYAFKETYSRRESNEVIDGRDWKGVAAAFSLGVHFPISKIVKYFGDVVMDLRHYRGINGFEPSNAFIFGVRSEF